MGRQYTNNLVIPVNPCVDDRLENVCFSLSDLQILASNLDFQLERMDEVFPHMVDYSANGETELPYYPSVLIIQLVGEAAELNRMNCQVCDRKGILIEDTRSHISHTTVCIKGNLKLIGCSSAHCSGAVAVKLPQPKRGRGVMG